MLTTSHGWPTTTTTVALAFFFLCCVSSGLLTHSILWNNIYVQIRVLPFVWQPSSVFRFLQSALCTVRAWKKFRRFRVSGWGFKLLLLTADDNDQVLDLHMHLESAIFAFHLCCMLVVWTSVVGCWCSYFSLPLGSKNPYQQSPCGVVCQHPLTEEAIIWVAIYNSVLADFTLCKVSMLE
jgi:hypothetical protein